jgi:UDP-glucose 4-epimerase
VLDDLSNGATENLHGAMASGACEFVKGSVIDPFDVEKAIRDMRVVFHLACLGVRHSIVHPYDNHRVNADGSLLVLEAARRRKIERFVHCSSSEVYGTAHSVPMGERHPTLPETVYGAGKLAGEAYARACFRTHALPTVVVRPFNTYGPRSHHEGDAGEVIPKSIVRALNGQAILVFGDGAQTRDFTYVSDTAEALVRAAEADDLVGRTVNAGSGTETAIAELAAMIRDTVANPDVEIRFTPRRPGDVDRLVADSTTIFQCCGWQPKIDFFRGLELTVDYFRNHPKGTTALLAEEQGRNWEGAGP